MPRAATAAKPAAAPSPAAAPTNYPVIRDRGVINDAADYVREKAEADRIEARQKERKARLISAMSGAPVAYAGSHLLSVTDVAEMPATPNVVITREMVGQVIPGKKGRAGYQKFEVR